MLAVYDLARSPVTYDITHWLANVEAARIAAAESEVSVRFVLGDRQVTERDQHFTSERKAWRLHNLLVPLCRLLPSVTEYQVGECSDPHVTQKIAYQPIRPCKGAPIFKSSDGAQSVIATWLKQKAPLVTISLRQSDLQTIRNSNISEWLKTAKWLREQGFDPVFVPDTEALICDLVPALEDFRVCTPAAMSPDLRLALYERACLNLFTSGGPWGLALYSDCAWMLCKTIFPTLRACSQESQEKLGFTPEAFPGPYQRIAWVDDSFEALKPVLEEMLPACKERIREMPKIYGFAVQMPKRLENIQATAERGLPVMQQQPPHDRVMALVCYGPSLHDTWQTLPSSGADVFTVSGAHAFLLERGICPKGHIETDPRPHKADFTKNADPRITYYLASCCDPQVFANVKGCPTEIWHAWDSDDIEAQIVKLWKHPFLLMGGSNVGLRAIAVGSALGYRKFAIYGMDCSLEAGKRHAGPHGGKHQKGIQVRPQGSDRTFDTTLQLVTGAREFLALASKMAKAGFEFDVYGDGLLPEMLRVAMMPKREAA